MKKFISRMQSLSWCQKILVILLFSLVTFFSLNYSGFCFDQMRYLSNEEKIRLVFEHQNDGTTIRIVDANNRMHKYEKIRYSNFEEFVQENPNCCRINPGGSYDIPPDRFSERITGFNSGDLIVLNFKIRYWDEKGNQHSKTVESLNRLRNCGKIYRF